MGVISKITRKDGRSDNQLRPSKVTYGIYGHAHGSVLFELGQTRVLCSVKVEKGVPLFLRGRGKGWLTAEYALLPASTSQRSMRDASLPKGHNGRSVEISRLIGRVFRSVVSLDTIGEQTIYIDCDVLNADGGTRCAAITGASLALQMAQGALLESGMLSAPLLKEDVAAVSVGVRDGQVLLDIDYAEDSSIDADYNFVMTGSGDIIEIQGTSEVAPLPWDLVVQMRQYATTGIAQLCQLAKDIPVPKTFSRNKKTSGFTLGDRLGKQLPK